MSIKVKIQQKKCRNSLSTHYPNRGMAYDKNRRSNFSPPRVYLQEGARPGGSNRAAGLSGADQILFQKPCQTLRFSLIFEIENDRKLQ
jgi:hypothetical protein